VVEENNPLCFIINGWEKKEARNTLIIAAKKKCVGKNNKRKTLLSFNQVYIIFPYSLRGGDGGDVKSLPHFILGAVLSRSPTDGLLRFSQRATVFFF
jgi:hypothetical protein